MLHTQSEEDSSAGRGVGRDFFKSSQRTTGNTLLGSFHRKCGRRLQHLLEREAGEDSEWREFSSTLSTQRVDRTFLHALRGKSGEDRPWPLKERRLLQSLSSDNWGDYPGLPFTTIWEVSSPPFLPE